MRSWARSLIRASILLGIMSCVFWNLSWAACVGDACRPEGPVRVVLSSRTTPSGGAADPTTLEGWVRAQATECSSKTYPKTGTLVPIKLPDLVVLDVRWLRWRDAEKSSQRAFALTYSASTYIEGPLWVSDDPGQPESWHELSDDLVAAVPEAARPQLPASPGVVAVHGAKNGSQQLVLQGRDGWHWASGDGGDSWRAFPSPGGGNGGEMDLIRLHPEEPGWLIAVSPRARCAAASPDACDRDLFVSEDLGATFRNATSTSGAAFENVRDANWAGELRGWDRGPDAGPSRAIAVSARFRGFSVSEEGAEAVGGEGGVTRTHTSRDSRGRRRLSQDGVDLAIEDGEPKDDEPRRAQREGRDDKNPEDGSGADPGPAQRAQMRGASPAAITGSAAAASAPAPPAPAVCPFRTCYAGWERDSHVAVSVDGFASPIAPPSSQGGKAKGGRVPLLLALPCGAAFDRVAGRLHVAVPSECPIGSDGRPRTAPGTAIADRSVTLFVTSGGPAEGSEGLGAPPGRAAAAGSAVSPSGLEATLMKAVSRAARADGDISAGAATPPPEFGFVETCLPSNLEDDSYNLVRAHDRQAAFVLADHAIPGSRSARYDGPVSDLYAPGPHGRFATLSLRAVYRRGGAVDLTRVEGLPGSYLANVADPPPSNLGEWGIRSLRSADGGASWGPLVVPKSFKYDVCAGCATGGPGLAAGGTVSDSDSTCAVHLHGPTAWLSPLSPRPSVYSRATAPGIVLATGNAGPRLDAARGECTWASSDGGLTWRDVAPEPLVYELSGSGSVLLAARHAAAGPTDRLLLSMDNGECWHDVALPEAMLVANIVTDSEGQGTAFVAHGAACARTPQHPTCTHTGGGAPTGLAFAVDVRELLGGDARACGEGDLAGPASRRAFSLPEGCALGVNRTWERKRPDVECIEADAYAAPAPSEAVCPCSADRDLQCEYGLEPKAAGRAAAAGNATGLVCAPMAGLTPEACPAWTNGVGAPGYAASRTGTRLVFGDQCSGVEDLIPDTDGRGTATGGGGGGGSGGSSHRRKTALAIVAEVLLGLVLLALAGLAVERVLRGVDGELAEGARARLARAGTAFVALAWALADRTADLIATAKARLRGESPAWGAAAAGSYFEPLSDRLEIDPEDRSSAPLFQSPSEGA